MFRSIGWWCTAAAVIAVGGCPGQFDQRNAFLRYTEDFGANASRINDDDTQAGGTAADIVFRRTLQLTLANNHPDAELTVNFAAWVKVSSIRSADQQDELLRSGYVQISREVKLGIFTLPPGTFVFNGPGVAGSTRLRIASGDAFMTPDIVTPDVVLLYGNPPLSCDDVGFSFTDQGFPLDDAGNNGNLGNVFESATGLGGTKTLAQYSAYQCDPFSPGLFLRIGGGSPLPNEFFEGEDIRVDFFQVPPADDGEYAVVSYAR